VVISYSLSENIKNFSIVLEISQKKWRYIKKVDCTGNW